MSTDPKSLFALAARMHSDGLLEQAVPLYRTALGLDRSMGECALHLGMALFTLKRYDEAEQAMSQAIALLPDDVDALNLLGAILFQLGKLESARQAHQSALDLAPDSPEALDGLGNVLLGLGQPDEAVQRYERAITIAPSIQTLSNLGAALKASGRPRQAIERFTQALELAPDDPDTLTNMGNAWQLLGDMDQALDCFERAIAVDPTSMYARWGRCFAHVPMVFQSEAQIEPARQKYGQALEELARFLDSDEQHTLAAEAVGANQPFYLAYHGQNDVELQRQYGSLCHRAMTARFPKFASPLPPRTRSGRLRVGILTGFMNEHSVWKIPTRGWAEGLDRDRFEVFGYHTGFHTDHCTEEARQLFDHFLHQAHDFPALITAIQAHELDALLFPEIGMDPTTLRVAALRLAPVQAVSLGHPMTTGLPTMDYFLTSDLMEPEGGETWYTEKLVRLPNLALRYAPRAALTRAYSRADFGLPENGILYFCPQSLFKYLPQHDHIFPRIAAQVPSCHFVFLEHLRAERLVELFRARLQRCFADHGLQADDFITILPHQEGERFHGLNAVCDLFLDSLGWSGFNTVMEATGAGLPAIACPTPFPVQSTPMRAYHTAAVLRMLGHHDAIAPDLDSYIQLAAHLGTDANARNELKQRTLVNRSRLYNDDECIKGLQSFLENTCRP
ncbi:MAG: tetratricopeptide repeat protein [Proteobacteria bacterium]|nr:tetratricopeptide repeat protein [Pseudomonadota bacterium]